jgi:CRP/FNR family transcriptional regulator, cyclic AMP receptor protein
LHVSSDFAATDFEPLPDEHGGCGHPAAASDPESPND